MKPTDLRGILRYIPQFREKTFILAIDGAIVTDENFANILLDVAVLRSLNIRVVLVHGASAQIEQLGTEQGVVPSDLDGTGITDAATLKLALTAANRLTHEILEGLSANDLRAASTNAIIAHPVGIIHGVDQSSPARSSASTPSCFRRCSRRASSRSCRRSASTAMANLSRELRRRRRGGGRSAQGDQADLHHLRGRA